MDSLPGLSDLPAKLVSQCGLIPGLMLIVIIWLAIQYQKLRAAWETERAATMKLIEKHTSAYESLAISHSKLEGILLAFQARGGK